MARYICEVLRKGTYKKKAKKTKYGKKGKKQRKHAKKEEDYGPEDYEELEDRPWSTSRGRRVSRSVLD